MRSRVADVVVQHIRNLETANKLVPLAVSRLKRHLLTAYPTENGRESTFNTHVLSSITAALGVRTEAVHCMPLPPSHPRQGSVPEFNFSCRSCD